MASSITTHVQYKYGHTLVVETKELIGEPYEFRLDTTRPILVSRDGQFMIPTRWIRTDSAEGPPEYGGRLAAPAHEAIDLAERFNLVFQIEGVLGAQYRLVRDR